MSEERKSAFWVVKRGECWWSQKFLDVEQKWHVFWSSEASQRIRFVTYEEAMKVASEQPCRDDCLHALRNTGRRIEDETARVIAEWLRTKKPGLSVAQPGTIAFLEASIADAIERGDWRE